MYNQSSLPPYFVWKAKLPSEAIARLKNKEQWRQLIYSHTCSSLGFGMDKSVIPNFTQVLIFKSYLFSPISLLFFFCKMVQTKFLCKFLLICTKLGIFFINLHSFVCTYIYICIYISDCINDAVFDFFLKKGEL